jgi:two-component system, NarL family, nitrate/nitrite sensor histidine kinase NarX
MIQHLATKPILLRIGALLALVVALEVVSMASSGFIAQTMEGLAAAVNQSGSLRMQSYRIGMALTDQGLPPARRAELVARLAGEFESRLASPRLAGAIPRESDDPVRAAYERVWHAWRDRMRPALVNDLRVLRGPPGANGSGEIAAGAPYVREVDGFVMEVDALVVLLEEVAEGRIARLQRIQAAALALTILVVAITLVLVALRVIVPLGELLRVADRARRGDFSGRTRFTGDDELGRLGAALNRMGEDRSQLYVELERRVEVKTQDLARSNQSLELLYRVGTRLNESQISEPLLKRTLQDIQERLGVGPVTLCLQDDPEQERGRLTITTRTPSQQQGACSGAGCLACKDGFDQGRFDLPLSNGGRRPVVSFPVEDRGERFGVLIVDLASDPPKASTLEPWQARLLGTLAGNLGTALKLHERMREGRRLALHEERGILARELHDSLAQSLTYLKIQAARLSAALDVEDEPRARAVLGELREGISSAYRQLRELLTTFRLKMDDRGLTSALEATVQEFRGRGTTVIQLDNRLPAVLLTPNEEIHVLQIVREALSNVVRHADARHAWVRLLMREDTVEVEVADDGRGIHQAPDQGRHYGHTIMRERALTLGGRLEVETLAAGGTRVRLRFRHRSSTDAEPVRAADPAQAPVESVS